MSDSEWIIQSEDYQPLIEKWQDTVDVMAEVCDVPSAFIVQYSPEGLMPVVATELSDIQYGTGDVFGPELNLYCHKVIETKAPFYVKDASQDPFWDDNPEVIDGLISYLGLPVFKPSGDLFGTICVLDVKATQYSPIYYKLMAQFRDIVEGDLKLIEQNKALQEIAITDELTGLYNRRGFKLFAQKQHKLAMRLQQSMGLLYMDIDDLKEINDVIGHEGGDEAIVALAECLNQSLRENDLSARIGGDEFVALVLFTDSDTLEAVTHRLQIAFERKQLSFDRDLNVSIGGVVVPKGPIDLDQIIDRADKVMYQIKRDKKAS